MKSMARSRPPNGQAGFTLVELVTVILILGVLAAVALPRYANLQASARAAKVEAYAGAIRAAAGLAMAQGTANGLGCAAASGDTVTMEGSTVALSYCYPTAAASGGIFTAANLTPTADGWSAASVTAGSGGAPDMVTVQLSAAATPASCKIDYTAAAGQTTPPVVTVTTSGC